MPSCLTHFVGVLLDHFVSGIEPDDEKTRIRQKMEIQLEVKSDDMIPLIVMGNIHSSSL